jgi:uncharacterized protein YbjT (DUF2867 family)
MTIESAATRSALVAGGTGLVGGHLLRLLGADDHYRQVTSLARREGPLPSGVDIQIVDFEKLDQLTPLSADDAFCCLGTTRKAAGSDQAFRHVDFDYVVSFARLARRAGATRFMLVSSLGASSSSSLLYPRTKGECEEAIQAIGFSTVVILRPSFLMGDRGEKRSGEAIGTMMFNLIKPALVGPFRKYAPVEATAVARTLVREAATAPAGITIVDSGGIR